IPNTISAAKSDTPQRRRGVPRLASVHRVKAGEFSFDAEVWEHDGSAAWHFVSLPAEQADDIEAMFGHRAAGFCALRVEVTIGATTWRTSIFPDAKRRAYVLPLKKAGRSAEGLTAGTIATVRLAVLDVED